MGKSVYATLYRDRDQQWRWLITDSKRKHIIGESHKGFDKMMLARENFELVTGMYAPAISKGERSSTYRLSQGYRSHSYEGKVANKNKKENVCEQDYQDSV